jgi:DNA modification methylase
MNKKWDYDVPSVEFWKEVYRVLKPGGHVLSFGGTRTYHRMVVNIEDAGFEIRDQIMWLYGSGFPKSHNIGKAVDKRGGESIGWFGEWLVNWRKENNIPQSKIAELFPSKSGGLTGCVSNWELGNNLPTNEQFNLICKTFDLPFNSLEEAERQFIGTKTSGIGKAFGDGSWNTGEYGDADVVNITKGSSPYEGWGTALKPANEPICVARKPLSEKSVAENVLKWGTGGINIDGCRVKFDDKDTNPATNPLYRHQNADKYKQVTDHGQKEGVNVAFTNSMNPPSEEGRFPANIILECICDEVIKGEKGEVIEHNGTGGIWNEGTKEPVGRTYNDKGDTHTNPMCPCYLMDEQSGNLKSTGAIRKKDTETEPTSWDMNKKVGNNSNPYAGQSGGASRFFYQAKVSKAERNAGLDEFEEKIIEGRDVGQDERSVAHKKRPTSTKNTHPTVKPVSLMAYLCRLVTPPNGIVLDPFMGSGSTGISAQLEGFRFCGMEMDEDYFKIASARIENFEEYRKFLKK